MRVLAFDTSSDTLAAAYLHAGGVARAIGQPGRRHAEGLMRALDECLAGWGAAEGAGAPVAPVARSDIDLFACALGPGSFTGLRIGMATAKGLSLASGKPWVAVPSLDCIAAAQGALEAGGTFASGGTFAADGGTMPGIIVPILDGRKGRVYAAIYEGGRRVSDWLDIAPADLVARLDAVPEVRFAGPDADLFAEYAQERSGFTIADDDPGARAEAMARLALDIFRQTGGASADLGPLYLREPEIG